MNAYLFTQLHGLRIGDRLITEKGPVSRHHAIFVQIPGGLPLVAENQVGKGVQYITLEEFLSRNGTRGIWIQKFGGTEMARENIVAQINTFVGTPYNLVNFNCEHFASLIQTGSAVSKQVAGVFLGAFVIGVGLLALGGGRR